MVVRSADAADWLLSRGESSATTAELAELLGVPEAQVRQRLHPAVKRGQWVMPVRGLWVPVSPEYRTWGAPPGIEIVDDMMHHLAAEYYVGWLSAAALHGIAPQAPQVFQVAVSHQVRDRQVGRTRFSFAQRRIESTLVQPHPTRSGTATISTAACTILDIADDIDRAGGLDNAATVIAGLAESGSFRVREALAIAPHFPAAAVRRAGWILDTFTETKGLGLLRKIAMAAAATPSRLDPSGPASGVTDSMWMLYLNAPVEPDL